MLAIKLFTLIFTVHRAVNAIDTVPACAVRCWDNTRYISKCLGDLACECGETKFQKTVHQCLYSQCDKVNFDAALRHTISQCPESGNAELFASPLVPNSDELRRREAEVAGGIAVAFGSGNPFGLPTESANSFLSESIASNGFPTQSVGNSPTGGASSSVQTVAITSTVIPTSAASPNSPSSQSPAAATPPPIASTAQPTSNVTTASSPSNTALPVFTGQGASINLSLALTLTTFAVVGSLLI